jgi:hypothetical protein
MLRRSRRPPTRRGARSCSRPRGRERPGACYACGTTRRWRRVPRPRVHRRRPGTMRSIVGSTATDEHRHPRRPRRPRAHRARSGGAPPRALPLAVRACRVPSRARRTTIHHIAPPFCPLPLSPRAPGISSHDAGVGQTWPPPSGLSRWVGAFGLAWRPMAPPLPGAYRRPSPARQERPWAARAAGLAVRASGQPGPPVGAPRGGPCRSCLA